MAAASSPRRRGAQAERLAYYPIWSAAHPAAVELAARLAALAPADLNRVFFTTGGSEAVESAWKLARAYFRTIGQPARTKVIARTLAYHGTTMGALSITGLPAIKTAFEPLVPGTVHVANTNRFRSPFPPEVTADDERFADACADAIEDAIVAEGPETVCAVYLEPVQNTGGCFPPPPGYFAAGPRDLRPARRVARVGRGDLRLRTARIDVRGGPLRVRARHDHVRQGRDLGVRAARRRHRADTLAEPFLSGTASFAHGITFAGHPVSCATALANLDVIEHEGIIEHVQANADEFRRRLESLRDLAIVGDVRGDGYFLAIELVKDPDDHSVQFAPEERERLMRGLVAPRLFESGLICRADDRVDPVVQLAPVLTSGPEEFAEIESILRSVLTEAQKEWLG